MSSTEPFAKVSVAPEAAQPELSLIGHDLREAVSDVLAGLRLIDSGSLDEVTRVQFERARAAGELMARLFEQGTAAAGGGDAEMPESVSQLPRLLQGIGERWTGAAGARGLRLQIFATGDLPTLIGLDRVSLERILGNLLSNAIKHSDRGVVALSVSMAPDRALHFVVRDSGAGFSDAALELLFQRDGRPTDADRPGSGLGLHIAHRLSLSLGGYLSVCNPEWGGAEVSLIVPHSAWRRMPRLRPEPVADLRGRRVLLAEDAVLNQLLMVGMLEALGATCVTAADGLAAIELLERAPFDLALVDIEMPGMDGTQLLQRLRRGHGPNRAIPVIAVTAHVQRAVREAVLAAGADAVMTKPLPEAAQFGAILARALDAASRPLGRRGWGLAAGALPADEGDVPEGIDLGALERVILLASRSAGFGADASPEERRRLVVARIVTDLGEIEAGVSGGLTAGTVETVLGATHRLAALAGTLGDAGLSQLARKANTAGHEGREPQMRQLCLRILVRLDRLLEVMRTRVPSQESA